MNLDALTEIVENQDNYLEGQANDLGLKVGSVRAATLIVDDEGYDALKGKQVWVFDNAVRPLIEDVPCDGYRGPFGEDDIECNNLVDDDDLVESYQSDSFLCGYCQGAKNNDDYDRDRLMNE